MSCWDYLDLHPYWTLLFIMTIGLSLRWALGGIKFAKTVYLTTEEPDDGDDGEGDELDPPYVPEDPPSASVDRFHVN